MIPQFSDMVVVRRPGNRLRKYEHVWRNLRASPEIVSLIRDGHEIRFLPGCRPKLSATPNLSMETRLPAPQMTVIRAEIADLVAKGAMRRMSWKEACSVPGFYSRMFCGGDCQGCAVDDTAWLLGDNN